MPTEWQTHTGALAIVKERSTKRPLKLFRSMIVFRYIGFCMGTGMLDWQQARMQYKQSQHK